MYKTIVSSILALAATLTLAACDDDAVVTDAGDEVVSEGQPDEETPPSEEYPGAEGQELPPSEEYPADDEADVPSGDTTDEEESGSEEGTEELPPSEDVVDTIVVWDRLSPPHAFHEGYIDLGMVRVDPVGERLFIDRVAIQLSFEGKLSDGTSFSGWDLDACWVFQADNPFVDGCRAELAGNRIPLTGPAYVDFPGRGCPVPPNASTLLEFHCELSTEVQSDLEDNDLSVIAGAEVVPQMTLVRSEDDGRYLHVLRGY